MLHIFPCVGNIWNIWPKQLNYLTVKTQNQTLTDLYLYLKKLSYFLTRIHSHGIFTSWLFIVYVSFLIKRFKSILCPSSEAFFFTFSIYKCTKSVCFDLTTLSLSWINLLSSINIHSLNESLFFLHERMQKSRFFCFYFFKYTFL